MAMRANADNAKGGAMYAWEGCPFEDIARLCGRRDPRRYPQGCLTLGTAQGGPDMPVLQWFKNRAELSGYLWRMEPQRWGIRAGSLAVLKEKTEPVFIRLDVEGPNDDLLESHNQLTRPFFHIAWWGSFEALCQDDSEWPNRIRNAYRGKDRPAAAPTIAETEHETFIDYLQAHYLPKAL